jgi:signal transduction histidine kinase
MMTEVKLHRLLERQIRKFLSSQESMGPEWMAFIQSVNEAYRDFDVQREQLERILEISSNELFKTNAELNSHKEELEKIVEERTSELRLATEAARKANESKAMFLSNMSHEIRTPLHAISGLTELLIQEGFSGHVLENLQSIRFAADSLMVIVDDILDFSKIEAGKLNFEKISFSPKAVIKHVYKSLGIKATAKNIELHLEYDAFIPRVLIGDPTRFQQILINLVGNAIKFTEKGKVVIRASCQHKMGDKVLLAIEVMDTGIGIAPEQLDRIFDSFSQASGDTTRKFGGTGLGLTISKRLIELQDGSITVKSTPGAGSTFSFEIPFVAGQSDSDDAVIDEQGDEIDFSDLKVLLVEDNKINQQLAKQVLLKWNIRPDLAENGFVAIERMKDKFYDLILLDLQMPVMGGFETATVIRDPDSGVNNHQAYIIALTADAFAETRKQVLEKGMNDYISKPFSQVELLEKIKNAASQLSRKDAGS